MVVSKAESAVQRAAREAAALPDAPDPVRTFTPEERAAFLAARPDVLAAPKPGETKRRR